MQQIQGIMTTLAEKLRTEPGIDVRRLKAGTYVFVETAEHVYEMKVVLPYAGLLEITSSDPPLHTPVVGQFVSGRFPPYARWRAGSAKVF